MSPKGSTLTCKSCGNVFSGNYCNNCGEKVIRKEDKKVSRFIGDFINAISFADNKFWRTLKTILLDPGKFSKDFVEGKRQKYMKPISIFFFANLIYFFLPMFNTFHSSLQVQVNGFLHSGLAKQMVNKKLEQSEISFEEFAKNYNTKTIELSKLFLIGLAGMMALFLSITHYAKTKFLVDHLAISLELMTFVILFAVQLQGAVIKFLPRSHFLRSEFSISAIAIILLAYFIVMMERNFYQRKKSSLVLFSIISLAGFTIVLYLYRALLFFLTFWSL